MDQDTRALDMPQEIMPQPHPFRGAFHQPGDIRQDNCGLVIHVGHAQVRVEGRERVGGNLGLGIGQHRKQGGFAGIRHARRCRYLRSV